MSESVSLPTEETDDEEMLLVITKSGLPNDLKYTYFTKQVDLRKEVTEGRDRIEPFSADELLTVVARFRQAYPNGEVIQIG